MKRRAFIKSSSIIGGSGLLPACGGRTIKAQSAKQLGQDLIIDKAKLSSGQLYIAHPSERYPISVRALNDGQYTATLMQCSHQKCETEATAEGYICPCHGARFDERGQVLKGPAEKNLPSYPVELKDQQLWVKLG